ncbi:PilC/PilY family type IV pilus protein [uncultured Sphaerotilus sp.]|uniref:pilus assembly protein n=1 Tax=uncultured Sphaerotilus sp. TaxID=474984 RepID=UPI0030CA2DF2
MTLCHQPPARLALAAALACGMIGGGAHAALVDVSNVPLNASLSQVKPNIMFILDDSGSMGYSYMPDEAGVYDGDGVIGENYGYRSAHCNGLAFNPVLPYRPPVRADGTSFPDASFTAAPEDGFNPSAGSTSLDGSIYYTYKNDKKLVPLSWTYLPNGSIDQNTPFYKDCTLSRSEASDQFLRVTVTTASDAVLRQQYANWYAYYRTRRLLMRTATGEAFRHIGEGFRVGFTVISDSSVTSNSFLDVKDFTPAQRSDFYDLLYTAQTAEGFTPLRGALSKTGRYFANKIAGQRMDPMQYSCQRNYALLSTDGYWNSGLSGYAGLETASYGPLKVDGSRVGQQDGAEARPMKDSTGAAGGGDSDSLADVAQYFWATDLRSDFPNNVPVTKRDTATHQHLNTFTVGLGVRGTLSYDRNYLSLTTGDYADIQAGRNGKEWPVPIGTVSATPNTTNATHIDDLWHAAVNGRGQYFSATDPQTLSDAIGTTLNEISKDTGSSAAASASSLTPVTGDNWVFLPSYSNSPNWYGDLRAFQFTTDAVTAGLIAPDTSKGQAVWSAKTRLDERNLTDRPRRILFGNGAGALLDFTYANLVTLQYNSDFDELCTGPRPLSQCNRLSPAARDKATGENLVNFLRGDMQFQLGAVAPDNQVFRNRYSRLGDFVNAAPVYVAKPPFKYGDAGYSQFITDHANRTKMVYAPANDGLLHAFQVGENETDLAGGEELWAFVPRGVLPHLRRLADVAYDAAHTNLLDATPTIGDVYANGQWHTILVGGMGAGGRYYYALDITNPASPALLWEFSDANLGLTFGNPVITKDAKGTWLVAFTSGINNVGDGRGRLYLVDALTGKLRTSAGEIVTAAGDTTTPSNLGRLNAWVPSDADNTALRFYAGDMLGNLWRFDHDDRVAPSGAEATLLGQALGPNLVPQPITGKPVLTELVNDNVPITVVSFGTGQLLNNADLTSTGLQTIYSIRDTLGATSLGPLRDPKAKLVRQELNSQRLLDQAQSVDWNAQNGWYVDLNQSSGERVSLDGIPLASGLIAFASTVPNGDPCGNGGSSYLYQFLLPSGDVRDVEVSNSLIVGVGRVMDSTGRVSAFFTKRDQSTQLKAAGAGINNRSNTLRRAAWRELN